MKRIGIAGVILAVATSASFAQPAVAQRSDVRIGQAVPTMSFLPLLAARALDGFKEQGLDLKFASIRGGDPAALAALDSGDIDFAAVGSDTALAAISKGQSFQLIYALMSQVTLELVVSNEFLKRSGASPSDPIQRRIMALRGATIGVSAVGGAQDRSVRWLMAQGGMTKRDDINIALIGPPPAINAALDHGQIDGFMLSPPEGRRAELRGTGKVFIRMGKEFPKLGHVPYLVLVAKVPLDKAQRDLAERTVRALQAASRSVLSDEQRVAAAIQRKFYPKLDPDVVLSAIRAMAPGIKGDGRMTPEGVSELLQFTVASGGTLTKPLDPNPGPHAFWTNDIVDSAAGSK